MHVKRSPARVGVVAFLVVGAGLWQAQAGSSAWQVDAGGSWADAANWDTGVPGSTALLNSPDIATFGAVLSAGRSVAVGANRNVGGVTFSNSSPFGYTLSGGALLLSSGGAVQNTADAGAHADSVGCPVVLQGNGGSATFGANSAVTGCVLRIEGDVTAVATAGKTNTLTLTGAGTNASESAVAGAIGDGAGGGRLAVVKDGAASTWVLSGSNTFGGVLSLLAGTLIAEHGSALGSGAVTQSVAAALALRGGITVTGKTLVLGGGTPSAYGSLDSYGGTNTWAGAVVFANTTPRLNVATGKLVITGTVVVNSASGNPTIGGFGDGEIRGVISGVSSKTLFRSSSDTGTWFLTGTNTFAGPVTCANGAIAVNNDKSLGSRSSFSATALTLGGASTRGTLRAIADVTLSDKYGISLHNAGGILRTDPATTLTVNGVIADRTSAPYGGPLTKTGAGTLVLGAANTFTNWFEVSEGTVVLGRADALKGTGGVTPKLKVDGTLNLGGFSVTNPVLTGTDGTVTNGTLRITAETSAGGTGAISTLRLPATVLQGVLRADVASDGSADLLAAAGSLTLDGATLSVTDPGLLNKAHEYTLAVCSGGAVSGRFAAHNLPENWWVDTSDGRIQLKYFAGMILRVR